MRKSNHKWDHLWITQYTDEYGRARRTLNSIAACMAPPGSNDRKIANAYMGSPDSGYSILFWEAGTIQVITQDTTHNQGIRNSRTSKYLESDLA